MRRSDLLQNAVHLTSLHESLLSSTAPPILESYCDAAPSAPASEILRREEAQENYFAPGCPECLNGNPSQFANQFVIDSPHCVFSWRNPVGSPANTAMTCNQSVSAAGKRAIGKSRNPYRGYSDGMLPPSGGLCLTYGLPTRTKRNEIYAVLRSVFEVPRFHRRGLKRSEKRNRAHGSFRQTEKEGRTGGCLMTIVQKRVRRPR
jgi:hypothetical protein